MLLLTLFIEEILMSPCLVNYADIFPRGLWLLCLWENLPTLFSLETLFWFPNKGQYILMVSLLFVQNYASDVFLFFLAQLKIIFIMFGISR